jgi:hypothetical protein
MLTGGVSQNCPGFAVLVCIFAILIMIAACIYPRRTNCCQQSAIVTNPAA